MFEFNRPVAALPVSGGTAASSAREGPHGFTEASMDKLIKDVTQDTEQGVIIQGKTLNTLRAASYDAEHFIAEIYDLEDAGKATDSQFKRRVTMMSRNTAILRLVAKGESALGEGLGRPCQTNANQVEFVIPGFR